MSSALQITPRPASSTYAEIRIDAESAEAASHLEVQGGQEFPRRELITNSQQFLDRMTQGIVEASFAGADNLSSSACLILFLMQEATTLKKISFQGLSSQIDQFFFRIMETINPSKLEEINLFQCTQITSATILRLIKKFPQLHQVHLPNGSLLRRSITTPLRGMDRGEISICDLSTTPEDINALSSLKFFFSSFELLGVNHVDDKSLETLARNCFTEKLLTFKLSKSTGITDLSFKKIVKLMPNLLYLKLKKTRVLHDGLIALSVLNPKIEHINLGEYNGDVKGITALVKGCQQLKSIVLKNCITPLTNEVIDALAAKTHLEMIDFKGTRIPPDAIFKLFLRSPSLMKIFDSSGEEKTRDILSLEEEPVIARAFNSLPPEHKTLIPQLWNIRLTDSFLNSCRTNPNIEEVDLSGCLDITNDSIRAMILLFPNIRNLKLSRIPFTGKKIDWSILKHLSKLELKSCTAFTKVNELKKCTQLQELNLSNTDFSFIDLLEIIASCKKLFKLTISPGILSEEQVAILREKMATISIV